MSKSILIVEDDKALQKYLKDLLTENLYPTAALTDGVSVLNTIKRISPDLVLLDLNLPTVSGESICVEIKKEYPDLPVVILTAKDSTSDKVAGFDLGADEYITKPFEADELLARIKARLRDHGTSTKVLEIADLEINTETKEVKRAEKLVQLTPQEFKLLEYMVINRDKVLSRDVLLSKIWANSLEVETRVIDVYISYLRKKIDKGHKQKLIKSIRGFGYSIRE